MNDRTMNFIKNFKKINLPLNGVRLPTFKIEDKYKKEVGVNVDVDNVTFLKALMRNGSKKS